jgi:hypothetical protein
MNKGKMTLEEFQQILKDAEISTDFESILNALTGYFYRLSDESIADGYESLSKMYMIKGNRIYNALDQRGYYDEDKSESEV